MIKPSNISNGGFNCPWDMRDREKYIVNPGIGIMGIGIIKSCLVGFSSLEMFAKPSWEIFFAFLKLLLGGRVS